MARQRMCLLFNRHSSKPGMALVLLAVVLVAGCSSRAERAQTYYESGKKLLAAHDYTKASIEFRNAVKLKEDLLPAWRALAESEEASRHWEGLVPALRTIISLDPKDDAARLKLARILLAAGATDQSLKLVNDISEPDTNNATLLALKAAIFYKLKDNDTAVRDAQAALKIDPSNLDALTVLAVDRLADNDPKGALNLLSSVPEAQTGELGVQLLKLRVYEQLKDYPHIESLLRALAEQYPQQVMFRKQLARFYISQRRPDDAEKELRAITAANPKDSQAAIDLIRFLYTVKGPAAADNELNARIKAGGDVFPYQLAIAEFDFDQGKPDDSFKLLAQLGGSDSPTQAITAKILAAELYLRQKNTDAAEKIVDDILAQDSRNVDALKLRASIRLSRGQFDAAITDLREALNDQPQSAELMLMLATAYESSGSIDLADKQFADATKASNYAPSVGLSYVAFLRRRGGLDRAYDLLTELANRSPRSVQILSALAEAKLARQDWAGAEEIADRIKRIDTGNTGDVADQISGAALSGQGKYDASIAAFQNAVSAAPSAAQPMVNLVTALVRAKQPDKAVAFLQSVLKENPNNAEAYVLLGNLNLSSNAADQAEQNFKAAITKQPKNPLGYQALAGLELRQKKFDAALDTIRAGLKEQPDSVALRTTLAGILEQKGDYEAAITEYQNLLKLQPGSLILSNNLASLLADHRTDKASLDQAQSLATALRDSPVLQFKDTLGWVYYRQGDFNNAVPLLEAATAGLPNNALVHYHLGMAYIGVGQSAKASEQLKEALTGSPESELEAKINAGLKKIATQ
jgi:cellulose synthase operon protein C